MGAVFVIRGCVAHNATTGNIVIALLTRLDYIVPMQQNQTAFAAGDIVETRRGSEARNYFGPSVTIVEETEDGLLRVKSRKRPNGGILLVSPENLISIRPETSSYSPLGRVAIATVGREPVDYQKLIAPRLICDLIDHFIQDEEALDILNSMLARLNRDFLVSNLAWMDD